MNLRQKLNELEKIIEESEKLLDGTRSEFQQSYVDDECTPIDDSKGGLVLQVEHMVEKAKEILDHASFLREEITNDSQSGTLKAKPPAGGSLYIENR